MGACIESSASMFNFQVLAFTDSVYLQDFGQSPMDDILDDEGQMG